MDKKKSNTSPIEEKVLWRIPLEIILVTTVLAIPAYFLFDLTYAGLFWAGGFTGALSFWGLKISLTRLLSNLGRQVILRSLLFYLFRLLLIVLIFFIIILLYRKKVIVFAIGFSMLVIVIMVEAIIGLLGGKTWKN